jgi:nucleoside-diphosphate-sugar epimerase
VRVTDGRERAVSVTLHEPHTGVEVPIGTLEIDAYLRKKVFEAAVSLGIDKIVFISTTSVYRPDSRYGSSKILAELLAEDYRKHRGMNVITLRPRGFIPYWNSEVYASYSDWARWFWKGVDEGRGSCRPTGRSTMAGPALAAGAFGSTVNCRVVTGTMHFRY